MNPTTAPIWRRLAALFYDSFILLALSFIYGAIVTAAATLAGTEHSADYQPMINSPLFPLGWLLTLMGFYCFFWRRSGQTVGMKTWHIQVVDAANNALTPSWRQCAVRALVAIPSVLFFGIGFIYGAMQSSKQTLQDKYSGTKIILVKPEKKARS